MEATKLDWTKMVRARRMPNAPSGNKVYQVILVLKREIAISKQAARYARPGCSLLEEGLQCAVRGLWASLFGPLWEMPRIVEQLINRLPIEEGRTAQKLMQETVNMWHSTEPPVDIGAQLEKQVEALPLPETTENTENTNEKHEEK